MVQGGNKRGVIDRTSPPHSRATMAALALVSVLAVSGCTGLPSGSTAVVGNWRVQVCVRSGSRDYSVIACSSIARYVSTVAWHPVSDDMHVRLLPSRQSELRHGRFLLAI
jgi:hypothetical protein